jgi:hypothetical protein
VVFNGRKIKALCVNQEEKEGLIPIASLNVPFNVKAFSVEQDLRLTSSRMDQRFSISKLTGEGPHENVLTNPDVKAPPDKWYHSRMEVLVRSDPELGHFYEVKGYVNGRLKNHFKKYTRELQIGLAVERGSALTANFVVREMTPKIPSE